VYRIRFQDYTLRADGNAHHRRGYLGWIAGLIKELANVKAALHPEKKN
jgi:hypothetical protein